MDTENLCYVSARIAEDLRNNIEENLHRYLVVGFDDLAGTEGWSIPLSVKVDLEPLGRLKLDTGPDAEVVNSLLVWQSLAHLTPSLASEGRIWTRLCHFQGLQYARARWIGNQTGSSAVEAIATHFFGATRTARRDDNAIGRLWWNAFIARQAVPKKHHEALKALLKSADIRSNIVERAWSISRPAVAGAVLRAIMRNQEVTATEQAFREFMKAANRRGGGLLFELMTEHEMDAFMESCVPSAK